MLKKTSVLPNSKSPMLNEYLAQSLFVGSHPCGTLKSNEETPVSLPSKALLSPEVLRKMLNGKKIPIAYMRGTLETLKSE